MEQTTEEHRDRPADTSGGSAGLSLPLPDGMSRMETGPVRFGDDWTGIFLRGDDAARMGMAMIIGAQALQADGNAIDALQLESYGKQLQSCLER